MLSFIFPYPSLLGTDSLQENMVAHHLKVDSVTDIYIDVGYATNLKIKIS